MEDITSEFKILQAEFAILKTEFVKFKEDAECELTRKYDCVSIEEKLNDIRSRIAVLDHEISDRLSALPVQQTLNVYYLEHRENYDTEFYHIDEVIYFLKDSIFKTQDVFLTFSSYTNEYSFHIQFNGKDTYFQFSYAECKDFLIQVSCFDESITGTSYKYCLDTKELVARIKTRIFDLTMTT